MFCEKCGAANEGSSKFCADCGAELVEAQIVEEEGAEATESISVAPAENSSMLGNILKIAIPVGAVALILIILACAGVFKSGAEKAVERYFKAMVKGDGKAVYSLTVDPYKLADMLDADYYDYDDEKDVIEFYEENAEETVDDLEDEFGDNLKVKVEIKDVKKYSKDEIKSLNEYIEDNYDETYDGKNVLQDIRVIKVKATISGSDDDDKNTDEMVAYKIKGKWYAGGIAGLYDKDSIKSAIKSVED